MNQFNDTPYQFGASSASISRQGLPESES